MTDKKGKAKVDESILDAANKIWMAGLGAVQTAEKEGSKLFKTLVDKGVDFQSMRREISERSSRSAIRNKSVGPRMEIMEHLPSLIG